MEITLKGTVEEVASLVVGLQERQDEGETLEKIFKVNSDLFAKIAIDGRDREVQ